MRIIRRHHGRSGRHRAREGSFFHQLVDGLHQSNDGRGRAVTVSRYAHNAPAAWGNWTQGKHWLSSAKESALLWNTFDQTVGIDNVDVKSYFSKPGTP